MVPDYQKMYSVLFNAVTDAVKSIQQGQTDTAKEILIRGQRKTEELYICGDGEDGP